MILCLQAIIPETTDVNSFIFVPESAIEWRVGQSIRLELPAGYDLHERRFTIASAPQEKVLRITTRRSDSLFKRALWNLKEGDMVQVFSVEGDFIWKPASRYVFVAAGLGITPFRALLNDVNHARPIELLHSAKEHIFAEELLTKQESGTILYRQFDRRITADDIPYYEDAYYYIAGPRGMVKELVATIEAQGIKPGRIVLDVFTGY